MMTNSKNRPKRRFSGFDGEWEQEKFGKIATIINGRAYSQDELLSEGKYKVLRVGNFYTNESWYYSNLELDNKYYANNGDLLYTWSATFGPHIWSGDKVIYHYHIWKVELSERIDKKYILQLLEKDKSDILSNKNGSTMVHITKDGMENKLLMFPEEIEEQTKIGSFLKQLDQCITLHQHKLDKLKNLKKSYLAELFPAEGERVPKRRFPGFEGEWKEKKLGEVVEKFDNLRIPVASKDRIAGNIPYYGANGIQDYVEGFTHDGEFVLLAEDGANDLNDYPVQYVNGKIWVNNHAHVIQGKNNLIDNKFLLFAIKQIQMEPYLVGGGRAKLNAEIMMNLPLTAPEISEQRMIGAFLMKVEKQISLQQEKLAKLKDLKKAYLNELFV